jgi:hypothetical protein
MSWLKTLFADVRSNFVGLIMAAIVAIFSPVFAAIWKNYSKQDVPWTIFVIVSCIGVALLFVAIRLTKKFPILSEEKLRELQHRKQQALSSDPSPPSARPSVKKPSGEWSEPRYKRIKDCIRDASHLLRDDGKRGAQELWSFNAICQAGADQLHDNSEVVEVCEALQAHGYKHPFRGYRTLRAAR